MRRLLLLLLLSAWPAPAGAQSITVSNGATLGLSGGALLDLHGATATFDGATLDENGGRAAGGTLTAAATLNAPTAVDVGGLGAIITSSADLGPTTVTRGHGAQTAGAGQSILRWYDVAPTNDTALDATLVFSYHDDERNSLDEAGLTLYRSTDGGATWTNEGGTVLAGANTITLSGVDAFSRWTAALPATSSLALLATVLLEGAYSGSGTMSTALNAGGHLPTTQPYGVAPWSFADAGTVAAGFFAAHPGVVDWLYLQLRTGEPAGTMAVAAEAAALLLDDGTVVTLDGAGAVSFDLEPGAYYVAVFHRNHLAAMSSSAVDFTSGTGTWDFTTALNQAYGTNPVADLGDGRFGLFAGDADASGGTTALDNTRFLQHNGTAGYLPSDFNLSGGVTAADQSRWLRNNGKGTQVPAASAALPAPAR